MFSLLTAKIDGSRLNTLQMPSGLRAEVETPPRDSSDANTRKNTIFSRKYYLPALTDERYAVKIVKGTAAVSTDDTVTAGKTYYAKSGLGYVAVVPAEGDSPKTKGWYEITAA